MCRQEVVLCATVLGDQDFIGDASFEERGALIVTETCSTCVDEGGVGEVTGGGSAKGHVIIDEEVGAGVGQGKAALT